MNVMSEERVKFYRDQAFRYVNDYVQENGVWPKLRMLSQRYGRSFMKFNLSTSDALKGDYRFLLKTTKNGGTEVSLRSQDSIEYRIINSFRVLGVNQMTVEELEEGLKGSGIKRGAYMDTVLALIEQKVVRFPQTGVMELLI